MAAVAWIALDRRRCRADPWPLIAATIADAAGQRRLELRDCIVLVPFAQLMPLASRAFAERGGWMPRIETTGTLAQALGAQTSTEAEGLTFDAAIDALNAQAILSRQAWARSWQERDPRGFAIAAVHLAQTSHTFARCAQAMRPAARAGYWSRAREALALVDGSGARERVIARIALEWAALSAAPATDRLFSTGPAAWFAVNAGGRDALTLNLLDAAPAQTPCIVIDLDTGGVEGAEANNLGSSPTLALCEDFEDEAQCAAAQVLCHLQLGQRPVALVAQDRVLVRRVRALLERESVPIRDETGWKLATTRAAARVMALLLAARPDASTDHLLDWLKTGVCWPEVPDAEGATGSLEAQCRELGLARVQGLHAAALDSTNRRLLRRALASLNRLPASGPLSLKSWLGALSAALEDCGAMTALYDDAAGRQLISTLGLVGTESARLRELRPWAAAGHVMLTLTQFTRWVDAALETARFLPEPVRVELADVIIAPLAQTILRPFAAIVFPGTDHSRLGATGQSHPLLSDAQAVGLGLEGAQQRREIERLGFAQLEGAGRLTLLRRCQDAGRLTTNSPLIEQLAASLRSAGRDFSRWVDPRIVKVLERQGIDRHGPSVADMLPQRLSASAFEALRACPYRFFAMVVLRLRVGDELERDLEKRDYGNWLHAVLLRFHLGRDQAAAHGVEVERLMATAKACQIERGLDDEEFLPYAAAFKALAPRYVEWLHARDAQGLRWLHGEYSVTRQPEELGGVEIKGQIDRIDVLGGDPPAQTVLIDYKTGNAEALKAKVREPYEDTQLAFYAALLAQGPVRPLSAFYLALDSQKGIQFIEHLGVAASAQKLVEGMASELHRLRAGARLHPLGEGSTCEFCEARGLCRRDHWASTAIRSQ
jgi:ATP-dependent helicase/nuclease subunit B